MLYIYAGFNEKLFVRDRRRDKHYLKLFLVYIFLYNYVYVLQGLTVGFEKYD